MFSIISSSSICQYLLQLYPLLIQIFYFYYIPLTNMSKLNIADLLSSLPKDQNKQTHQTPKFAQKVIEGKNKKINVLSKKKQQMMRRQSNYEMAKQQMDKWVGIIKVNREKQSINFQHKEIANLNVNFFPSQPLNDFHKKIQSKLQNMNVQSQKSVLKHQESVLQKVDPQQAKRRLIEARKHRTAIFYEEQKRRRISKIKSKLYHKIKKRQKVREQTKKIGEMSPGQKNTYIQKLTKQRIKQRITLRHNTKNKHIKNLLRFNRSEKDSIQASINDINDIRNKKMERLNEDMIDEMSEQYDDQNFREQAMKDLQKQIQAIQNEENFQNGPPNQIDNNLKDLKFIQNAKQKRLKKEKQDAIKILTKLEKGKKIKEKDLNSDMQSEDNLDQDSKSESESEQGQQLAQRKIYGKKIKQDIQTQNPHQSKSNKKNIQSHLKSYLLGGDQSIDQRNSELVKDINIQNLQSKYQPQRVPIDLTTLIAENRQIYESQNNEAALENIRQFQKQKEAQIEEQVNKNDGFNKNKQIKGWGSWVGPGIKEKKKDPKEQLQKKLKIIEEIKRKRKDNALAHVTINQTRNKNLSQYFVRDLPRNFSNSDQFDYMQSQAIGPEWNSLNQFKDNIKPKVITKAGEVITAVRLPKKIENHGNSKKK